MNRRTFIKNIALGAAGFALAAVTSNHVDAREEAEFFGPENHAMHSQIPATGVLMANSAPIVATGGTGVRGIWWTPPTKPNTHGAGEYRKATILPDGTRVMEIGPFGHPTNPWSTITIE